MINELIEQIGRRKRLEQIIEYGVHVPEAALMARALLAVMDAQEKPAMQVVSVIGAGVRAVCYEGVPRPHHGSLLYTIPPEASVPDGWKLVPAEPTKAMRQQIHPVSEGTCLHCFARVSADCEDNVLLSWRDMLAAAPAPGGE